MWEMQAGNVEIDLARKGDGDWGSSRRPLSEADDFLQPPVITKLSGPCHTASSKSVPFFFQAW